MYSEDCKFIYVFSESARDNLLKKGYRLMKSIEAQHAYVFENDTRLNFNKTVHDSLNDVKHVKTNTLTF